MSDLGLDLEHEPQVRRTRRRRNALGCLGVVVAFALLGGAGYFVYQEARSLIGDRFESAEDYTGTGSGTVLVEVQQGQNASDIAATLVEKDVVASEEAFVQAASANPDSTGIQVGFYELREQMSAQSALEVLVDPSNMVQAAVTIREGLTVEETVRVLADGTDFTAGDYERVLRRPQSIGLPDYAEGNPEGYLFPATYQVRPDATPEGVLTMMVDRFKQAAASLDLVDNARALGISPHDAVTVASLVQAEARFDEDFPKVARVVYNRLDEPMPLQFDSTVHYAVGRDGSVGTSVEERNVDSPYNTYRYPGLPPTPIAGPGEQALEAALQPANGPWLYFVTTNPDTGVTKFAVRYQDHLRNKREFERWCAESESC